MPDEDLRELERAAQNGTISDVERYLGAKVRRSPDLLHKLVRRVIRLERVITRARANEDDYYAEITTKDFLDFIEREMPERPRRQGILSVSGEWPSEEDERRGAPRGGNVNMIGGRAGPVPGPYGPAIGATEDARIQGHDGVAITEINPAVIRAMNETIEQLTARLALIEARVLIDGPALPGLGG